MKKQLISGNDISCNYTISLYYILVPSTNYLIITPQISLYNQYGNLQSDISYSASLNLSHSHSFSSSSPILSINTGVVAFKSTFSVNKLWYQTN